MKRIGLLMICVFLMTAMQMKAKDVKPDSIVKKEVIIEKKVLSQASKDSILYSKLSADQLLELKDKENLPELQRIKAENGNDIPLNGFGIVMIVLMPFLFVIFVMIILSRIRNRESQRKYDLYMKSLEMGQTIPEHFFDEPKKTNLISNLKKGILWLSVGLALLIYVIFIHENDALILGIVPTFLGIGYLLVHYLDKPKKANEQNG